MFARFWRGLLAAAPLDRWALFGASVVVTTLFVGGGALIYLGTWPAGLAINRLDYIGRGFLMMGAAMLLVICSLTLMSIRIKGPGGFEAQVGRDPDAPDPAPIVTTTTTTAVAAPTAPPPAPHPPQPVGGDGT